MKDIVIYGAGGFGREVACLLKAINEISPEWNLVGFFDDGLPEGSSNNYGPVLGGIEILNKWPKPLNVIISIANSKHRQSLVAQISNPEIIFPNIIAPNVNVFDKSTFNIGKGNLIFFGCRISCDVTIGNFNLFNGAVSLGHDVKLGSFNTLQPSSRISGDCNVGSMNFFGVQSVVLQGCTIGNNTRIGASSVVMRNTKDDALYLGNPAKIVNGL